MSEISDAIKHAKNDEAYTFVIIYNQTVVGRIALTGVARGPAQYANVGYFIDAQHNGKGYATRAVELTIHYAFQVLSLHRVQAGIMPRNKRSSRVLTKTGFRHEGLAKRYLFINGVWEDHNLFAITVEDLKCKFSVMYT